MRCDLALREGDDVIDNLHGIEAKRGGGPPVSGAARFGAKIGAVHDRYSFHWSSFYLSTFLQYYLLLFCGENK
jgi:hypothetical protein